MFSVHRRVRMRTLRLTFGRPQQRWFCVHAAVAPTLVKFRMLDRAAPTARPPAAPSPACRVTPLQTTSHPGTLPSPLHQVGDQRPVASEPDSATSTSTCCARRSSWPLSTPGSRFVTCRSPLATPPDTPQRNPDDPPRRSRPPAAATRNPRRSPTRTRSTRESIRRSRREAPHGTTPTRRWSQRRPDQRATGRAPLPGIVRPELRCQADHPANVEPGCSCR